MAAETQTVNIDDDSMAVDRQAHGPDSNAENEGEQDAGSVRFQEMKAGTDDDTLDQVIEELDSGDLEEIIVQTVRDRKKLGVIGMKDGE